MENTINICTDNNNNNNNYINNNLSSDTFNPQFTYNILSSNNINDLTKEPSNSILKLKMSPNKNFEFLVVNSNFSIDYLTLNPENIQLSCIGIYNEHKSRINDICFFKSEQSPMRESFISGDKDGKILLWDSRAKASSFQIQTNAGEEGEIFSLDTCKDFFVAGYGNEIALWDIRTMKVIGKSSFAHSEPVSSVNFYENFLISGGEDNIINIFDLTKEGNNIEDPEDKDTANMKKNILSSDNVEAQMNVEQSIFYVNALKPGCLGVITSVNTLVLVSLQSLCNFYEYDAKNEFFDYILDFDYDFNDDTVNVICGNFKGSIGNLRFKFSEQPKPVISTYYNSGIEQTFNSIGKIKDPNNKNNNLYLCCSDIGMMYLMKEEIAPKKIENLGNIGNNGDSGINGNMDLEDN